MNKRCYILLALLVVLASRASASCPPHPLNDPGQIQPVSETLMIVTHATSTHDSRFATKRGIDEAIRFAKNKNIPLVYLQDSSPERFYFMEDCHPDYWAYSEGGELNFEVKPAKVYVIGGHLELCLATTMNAVLYSWSKQPVRDREMTILMDAVYSNGKSIEAGTPYYEKFQKVMAIIMHGRPMGEHWPKITLLGTMGVINRDSWQIDYLKNILPRYDNTLPPSYRVELKINDEQTRVLQAGEGWNAPSLRFHFVDSALSPLMANR